MAMANLAVPSFTFAAGVHPLDPGTEVQSITNDELKLLEKLLESEWQSSLEVRGSAGWDDNLLLSDLARERSGFVRVGLEGMLWRPAGEQQPVELVGFLSANHRRMFSSGVLPADTEAFFQGEARWRPIPSFRLSLLTQGYFIDAVLDLSTESERLATPLRNAGFCVGAGMRWEPGVHWQLEVTGSVKQSEFRLIPEDYDEGSLGIRARWQTSETGLKLGLGVRERDRRYRDRNITTAGGRVLSGPRLRYRMPEVEVKAEESAKWHGDWKAAMAVSGASNDDNGGDYFNYRLGRIRGNLEWNRGPWEALLSLENSRYRWDLQVAGIGLDPPRRRRLERSVSLQLRRQINDHWFVFLETEREWVSANDPVEGYRRTVIFTGIGWNR